jgi:hypothetical protein
MAIGWTPGGAPGLQGSAFIRDFSVSTPEFCRTHIAVGRQDNILMTQSWRFKAPMDPLTRLQKCNVTV